MKHYASLGARFAKWRAVLTITNDFPSRACVEVNAHALARYAALCQEMKIVPIVEPEVLMEGVHTLARCGEVTAEVLHQVFVQLHRQGVMLEAMILKPNMVLPGLSCALPSTLDLIADATLDCLLRTVLAAVGGIAFLSGGQPAQLATARLNALNLRAQARRTAREVSLPSIPWPLTFSFGRALQQPALRLWAVCDANRDAAQLALLHRARCNGAAARGDYDSAMDAGAAPA